MRYKNLNLMNYRMLFYPCSLEGGLSCASWSYHNASDDGLQYVMFHKSSDDYLCKLHNASDDNITIKP